MRKIEYSMLSKNLAAILIGCLLFFGLNDVGRAEDLQKSELRCGWFDNPSPSNADLTDASGVWLISQQGEYTANGAWPKFDPGQWVQTGVGSYGYGCACIHGRFDSATQKVLFIERSSSKPLKVCRSDKKISKFEPFNPLK